MHRQHPCDRLTTGHNFAMDYLNCQVYCLKCRDYTYHEELQRVHNTELNRLCSYISRIKGIYRTCLKHDALHGS
jgi:hypothetical protein